MKLSLQLLGTLKKALVLKKWKVCFMNCTNYLAFFYATARNVNWFHCIITLTDSYENFCRFSIIQIILWQSSLHVFLCFCNRFKLKVLHCICLSILAGSSYCMDVCRVKIVVEVFPQPWLWFFGWWCWILYVQYFQISHDFIALHHLQLLELL